MANLNDIMLTDVAHVGDILVSATGDMDTITGIANLKNALFHRLITQPGSLVHKPNYGVGVKDFQNALSTLSAQRKLAGRIQEQFELDPRVKKVTGVLVTFDDLHPSIVTITTKVDAVGVGELAMQMKPFGDSL